MSGADVNYRDPANPFAGPTPLIVACETGQVETAKYLLQRGANANERYTQSPIQSHMAPFFHVSRYFNGLTPLLVSTTNGNLELVILLITFGALDNVRSGEPALVVAAEKGHQVRELIKGDLEESPLNRQPYCRKF